MFALSRIYYVASILPIRQGVMRKMETLIGNFIWAGHGIMRISINDIKNSKSCGGLGLPCINTMNKALMTSQCVRLLKSKDKRSISHIDFWMGSLLVNIFPSMGNFALDMDTPEYFAYVGDCFAKLMINDMLDSSAVGSLTNKAVYNSFLSLDPLKIVQDNANVDYTLAWNRLQSSAVEWEARDILLKLIHNKLSLPERLNRIGVININQCSYCTNPGTADIVHFFAGCGRIERCWSWLKLKLLDICPVIRQCSNWEILNLVFPKTKFEMEITWLVSLYIDYSWKHFLSVQTDIHLEKFFGFLQFKYKLRNSCVRSIAGLG